MKRKYKLPRKLKKLAKRRCKELHPENYENIFVNKRAQYIGVSCLFFWDDAPEGVLFWARVYDKEVQHAW